MLTQGVVHPLAVRQQLRQLLGELVNREGLVGTEVTAGTCWPGTTAVPDFHQLVTITAEQHELALGSPRHQHRHGIRLQKAGEITEVAVLPKAEMHIAIARHFNGRRDDGDALRAHHLHQARAALGAFVEFVAGRSAHIGIS